MQCIKDFLYKTSQLTTFLLLASVLTNCDLKASAVNISMDREQWAKNQDIEQIHRETNILSQLPPNLPNPVPPIPDEEPIPIPEPLPETPLEIAPPSGSESESLDNIPGTITISKFNFQGNTAFSDEELQEVVADFMGKPINFSQLLLVEEIIRNKYTEGCRSPNGSLPCYINSGAVIAADQIISPQNATIIVNVMEGELENIEITGTRGINESYIRSRLQSGISQP